MSTLKTTQSRQPGTDTVSGTDTAKGNAGDGQLTQATFREAMSRIATAVHVLTTDGAAGRAGATVSAVCSVTDTPPTILVCVNRSSRIHGAIQSNGVFCVNTLSSGHQALSDAFAGRGNLEMDARFKLTTWTPMLSGSPALSPALVSVDCQVETITDIGTHSVILGTVNDIRMDSDEGSLIYVRRGYHGLPG
ncbi:flavin reductase [Roseibium suaedae]|uniref:Flavin reductase n=1 Tax=Roseibium suaedae TaxID=735517 RepID=A0A1M7G7N3_9HYPH|nr:flavin reductase [Roseibium suaedae]SHM12404.1 flavin reductase [Roseibium suaedae]